MIKLLPLLLLAAATAIAGQWVPAKDSYGNQNKNICYWKHQPVYSKVGDPITFYERESCAHHLAYPYAYKAPPRVTKD